MKVGIIIFYTQQKDKFYESFMREKPNNNKGKGKGQNKRQNQPFRYDYADMKCEYCTYYKHCDFDICPDIMENLDDLLLDNNFFLAVEYADQCTTAHKNTLKRLQKYFREGDEYAGI